MIHKQGYQACKITENRPWWHRKTKQKAFVVMEEEGKASTIAQ